MKGKIQAIIVLTVLALMVFLAGCGEQEPEEQVEITFMHGWGGNLKNHKLMQEIYDDFAKENPDIIFNCIPYADSTIAVEKANDMLAVGKMPDIISTNGYSYYVLNAVKRDRALDLMPYIKADSELGDNIHPAVFDTWALESGELYTVPDAIEAAGYWYNEDIFIKAGVTDNEGRARVPETWEEFFRGMEAIQQYIEEMDEDMSVCSLEENQMLEFVFLARLAGEGEKGLAMAQGTIPPTDQEVLKNVMKDMERLYGYSVDVENIESARQNFIRGKSAVYFNGVWESSTLMDSLWVDSFRYACYPTNDGRSLAYTSASSGYVLAEQKDKKKEEVCIRFLKYMLSDKVQKKLAIETDQAPSNPNIPIEEIVRKNKLLGGAIEASYDADIQISTIRSVWKEDQFEVISEAMSNRRFSDEEIKKMVESLN